MSQGINIKPFQKSDSDKVIEFISDVIVNEFKFNLEFDTLDSDMMQLTKTITSLMEVAFGLQKPLLSMMIIPIPTNKNKKY